MPTDGGHHLQLSLRRDMRDTFVVVGVYQRWKQLSVVVPRCRRCRVGHRIEQSVFWVLVGSAVLLGLMLLAGALAWAKLWELALVVLWVVAWLLLWWGVRQHWFRWPFLAPKPERHAREHPGVQELVADGWQHFPARP
ncbi:hypothetical protein FHX69_2790 [Prauserella muralis]|nr:hypothetical protein FHX69_2790 [Prauserella muralis]